jgi:signal transduction histidine kinase/CheY-like chemotaxis protein
VSDTLLEGEDIYTIILHDLSEHKQLIEEKIKLEEQLHQSQKLETIGTLAGGIAHDFNNILTPLIGYTEMAMEHIPPDNAVHKYLKNILHSSNRAKDLVKQILSFNRKSEPLFEPVDIYTVVNEAITLLRASTPASITFDLNLEANSGAVLGDTIQLEQVLINLCTNAAHAMIPDGGTLYIMLNLVEVNKTLANQHPKLTPGTYVMLQVTDTGKGMDQLTLTHIFEPFFTSKPVGEGTGLGLSVVHGIVDKHHGAILVESQPGKGTTFNIYFPSIPAEDSVKLVEHEKIPSPGKGNILLVDDEEIIVEMYSKWLEKIGYNVTAETNSLQAREIFRKKARHFDIIITDHVMPKLTGIQLAKDILSIRPQIPIILYTGNTNSISVKACLEMGVGKIIMKPVNFATLNRSIKELLES